MLSAALCAGTKLLSKFISISNSVWVNVFAPGGRWIILMLATKRTILL